MKVKRELFRLDIERMAAEVQQAHLCREDDPEDLRVPRPFTRRPRPNTALISEACERKKAAKSKRRRVWNDG